MLVTKIAETVTNIRHQIDIAEKLHNIRLDHGGPGQVRGGQLGDFNDYSIYLKCLLSENLTNS